MSDFDYATSTGSNHSMFIRVDLFIDLDHVLAISRIKLVQM